MSKILMAVPESDCHCVVNQVLSHCLKELGHDVINLGTNCSTDIIANGIVQHRPDLTIVTCQNGHAIEDLRGLSERISHQSMQKTPIWIGGKLTITGHLLQHEVDSLKKFGITRIFPKQARLTDLVQELKLWEKQYAA